MVIKKHRIRSFFANKVTLIVAAAALAAQPAYTIMSNSLANAAQATLVNSTTGEWSTSDTRPGGDVSFVTDSTAPLGAGALQITTDSTNAAKAQFLHAANTPLADLQTISYETKQIAGPAVADPSYQLLVDIDNDGVADTNFVYEPYWNGDVTSSVWQNWNVASGKFWSSKTVGVYTNGAGGPPFYTLSDILQNNPDAVVKGFGVNVGSYNPGYTVNVDNLKFGDTTYNFDPNVNKPDAPTNLRFQYQYASTPLTTQYVNKESTDEGHLTLLWDNADNSVTGQKVEATFPDGTTGEYYQGPNKNGWPYLNGFAQHGDGAYTYTVVAVNNNGETASQPITIYYDTNIPTAIFTTAPANNSAVTGTIHVAGTAHDDVGLAGVFFDVRTADGATWKSGCNTDPVITYTNDKKDATISCDIDTTGLDNGQTYLLRIHAGDNVNYGNVNADAQRLITIDRDAPTITVKADSQYARTIGSNGIYNTVSFGLYDAGKVNGFTINGGTFHQLTPNEYSDANNIAIGGDAHYGSNTITVYDVAGNSASSTFVLDNVGPTITTKSNVSGKPDFTVGSEGSYSKISFSLFDQYNVSGYSLNGGTFNGLTPNPYSDANYITVNTNGAHEGTNTITVRDQAGNTSNYSFYLDSTNPTVTVKSNVNDQPIFTTGSNGVYSKVSFGLYDAGKIKGFSINGGAVHQLTPNQYSDINYVTASTGEILAGTNTITVYDLAGNATTVSFVIDNVGPTITVKQNVTGEDAFTNLGSNGTYNLVSFKLYDAYKVNGFSINGGTFHQLTPNEWSDANYISVGQGGGVEGDNYITLTDVAGNTTTQHFTLDSIAPTTTITGVTNTDGTLTVNGTVNDPTATVTVSVDDVNGTAVVDEDGNWTYAVDAPTSAGSHPITAVAVDTTGNVGDTATSEFAVAEPAPAVTETPAAVSVAPASIAPIAIQATTVAPLAITPSVPTIAGTIAASPAASPAVLGAQTENTGVSTPTASTSAVAGDSVSRIANAGFVLAWYWWLLIAAVVATIVWLIGRFIAARRANA